MYSFQEECLSNARRILMIPHALGEEISIGDAFHECIKAFYRLNESGLDDHSKRHIDKIKKIMIMHKTRKLTNDEIHDFSKAVDDLASWFSFFCLYGDGDR